MNTSVTGKLLRDQQGGTSIYAYNYWSSPVNNNAGEFTLNGGLYDGTDANKNTFSPQQVSFNSGNPYNGVQAIVDGSGNVSTPLVINDYWLNKYEPNTSGYAGWVKIDKNSALSPGVGFTMKGTGANPQNYVFKGLPNSGDYSFSINNGELALLGNPYPSSLDSEEFILNNLTLLDKIQLWVDGGSNSHYLSSYLGGYAIANLTGGVAASVPSGILGLGSSAGIIPTRYIAVGQGFFIEATGNGTIVFNNSQRTFQTEDGSNSNFYKEANVKDGYTSEDSSSDGRIWIGYQGPELFHRQLLLGFILSPPGADLGYNPGFDAEMTDPREDELFFIIDNESSKKYVIQGVGTYNKEYEFPVGLIVSHSGTHTIMLDGTENFTDDVYLKDAYLNTFFNLSDSDYSISLQAGEYLDRFFIVFQNDTTLLNETVAESDLNVYYKENTIVVENPNNLELSMVSIFNQLGQVVLKLGGNQLNSKKNYVPFMQQKGIYIVSLETGQIKKTCKNIKFLHL